MIRIVSGGLAALALVAVLVGLLHAWHGGGVRDIAAPAGLDVPATGVAAPMQSLGGRPMVDVTIQGKGPFPFILDTAATSSVIDPALQEELALPAGSFAASLPGGKQVPLITIEELRVGEATLRELAAVVLPVASLFPGEPRPQGVLSALAFPGHLVTFDYPGGKITIAKGELPPADGRRIFTYPEDDPIPGVPLRIAGREVRVHLDTGASAALMLPRRYLDVLPLASTPEESGKERTPAGAVPILAARVKGPIEMGAHTLDLGPVRFGDALEGDTGKIGYEALKSFVITLDSRNRRVRFAR